VSVERSNDFDTLFAILALINENLLINVQDAVDLDWFHTPFILEIIKIFASPRISRSVLWRDVFRILSEHFRPKVFKQFN